MADGGFSSWGTDSSTSYPGSDSWGGGTGNSGGWSDWGKEDSVSFPGQDNFDSTGDYTTGGWDDVGSSQYTPQPDNGVAGATDDPNSFWGRAKRLLMGNAVGMAGGQLGVPGPVSNGLLAAYNAPQGQKMNAGGDSMGRGIVNSLAGMIPGVGMMNTLSGLFGGPTLGSMMPRGASSGMGFGSSTGRGGAAESLLGGLGALYGYNQASKGLNSQIGGLKGLYGQNSPYAQTLRQQLERKDAASGRRSQYGPREVELQARLASLASGQAPMLNQLENQRTQMRTQGLGQLLQFGRQSGLFGGIGNMFNGGGYTPTDSLTNDFGGSPDDFWMRGTSGD